MKKLTFALACASTFALFAEIGAPKAGFEDYTDETGWAVAGKAEPGSQFTYWLYEGASGSEDGSTVKAYGGDNLAAPTTGGDAGEKYLELSTEGGTLWRSIAKGNTTVTDDGDIADRLGVAQSIPADGLYIDTMVQFTPTEDGGKPETADGDKLAIWLNVDSSGDTPVTNLMVRAGAWDYADDAMTQGDAASYVLAPVSGDLRVEPGTWYRLTVEAVRNVFSYYDPNDPLLIMGFRIRLDGVEFRSVGENPFSQGLVEWLGNLDGAVSADMLADIAAGKVFPSMEEPPDSLDAVALQAVGFKGSGALDNLAFYDENPVQPAAPIDFTLAWPDGVTPTSYQIGDGTPVTEGLTSGMTIQLEAGQKITLVFTNADGAKKTFTVVASADITSLTVEDVTFGWAEYLGEAIGGAYVIDDAAELMMFQKGYVAKLGTKDQTFKLGASITLTEKWPGIGVYDNKTNADAFEGTFDGAGYTISGVTFASNETGNNYRGFFNQINNAVVKNLTVEGDGFGSDVPSGEYGCALIVGCANNSTIENCIASGTIASGTHNVGGIVVRISDTTIRGCTNKANITGSYSKIGGIAVLNQDSTTACLIENCVNEGTLTAAGNAEKAGRDGLGGIIAYAADTTLTIRNCSNTGVLVKGEGANASARVGQIVGWTYTAIKADGTNTVRDDIRSVGGNDHAVDGLNYATVKDGVATLVVDAEAKNGASLKVMAAGTTVTLGAIGESITLDTTLATVTVTTTAENAEVTQDGNVYTVVAKSATEDWPEDPTVDAGKTAGDAYGITGELADAEADKLATWAKANEVAYAGAAEAIKVEAYLLNVANTDEAIEEGKANFKIPSITIDANGTVTVTSPDPDGSKYNGVITIKGSETVNGDFNIDPKNDTEKKAKFFKAFLSVK